MCLISHDRVGEIKGRCHIVECRPAGHLPILTLAPGTRPAFHTWLWSDNCLQDPFVRVYSFLFRYLNGDTLRTKDHHGLMRTCHFDTLCFTWTQYVLLKVTIKVISTTDILLIVPVLYPYFDFTTCVRTYMVLDGGPYDLVVVWINWPLSLCIVSFNWWCII
jgi:hypothetical protein